MVDAEIDDPRILQKIQALLSDLLDLRLHAPPVADADDSGTPGVGVWQILQWFLTVGSVMQGQSGAHSHRLVHRNDVHLSQGRRCGGRWEDVSRMKHDLVPFRFARACVRGHIADIDAYVYAHGVGVQCQQPMWLDEFGTSGDVGSLVGICECKAHRSIMEPPSRARMRSADAPAIGHGSVPVRANACECSRLLVRSSASNAYFTQSMSVIALPPQDVRLPQVIEPLWEDSLQKVGTKAGLTQERARKHKVKQGLAGDSDDEIWNAMTTCRGGGRRESRDRSIEVVWTGRAIPNDTAHDTGAVVRERFSAARRTVLIVGYVVYAGRELFRLLAARLDAEPSLQVTFVLYVGRRYSVTTTEGEIVAGFAAAFRATKWPGTRLPSVYYDPRSLAIEPRERSAMHAKCIVIDSTAALVTTAKFTHAAQEKSGGVGLRVNDPVIAAGIASRVSST